MTPDEIAKNVERLRGYDFSPREGEDWPQYMGRARRHRSELLQTINALVQLVGEMGEKFIAARYEAADTRAYNANVQRICNDILAKAAPIAALAGKP